MRRFVRFLFSMLMGPIMALGVTYGWACSRAGHLVDLSQAILIVQRRVEAHMFSSIGLGLLLLGVCYGIADDVTDDHFWVAALGLPIAIIGVLVAGIAFAASILTPEQSFNQARDAYFRHDLEGFDEYVNVESVLSDAVDQILVAPVMSEAQQQSTSASDSMLAGMSISALAQYAKQSYLPQIARSMDQFVVTGTLPADETQQTNSDQNEAAVLLTALLSEGLRAAVTTQLTYSGVQSTSYPSFGVALLTVYVNHNGQTGRVTFRMHYMVNHWQIVAVQNLPDFLGTLMRWAMVAPGDAPWTRSPAHGAGTPARWAPYPSAMRAGTVPAAMRRALAARRRDIVPCPCSQPLPEDLKTHAKLDTVPFPGSIRAWLLRDGGWYGFPAQSAPHRLVHL